MKSTTTTRTNSKEKYPYKSHFGSHSDMVVKDNEDGTVVCQDEFGEYTTKRDRLDNGLADPARYVGSRLKWQ